MKPDESSTAGKIRNALRTFWSTLRKTGPIETARRYPIPLTICGVLLLGLISLIIIVCVTGPAKQPAPEGNPSESAGLLPSASPVVSASPPVSSPSPSPSPGRALYPNPLTGLELGSADSQTLRPVALMHNNTKAAMPLLGVSYADILYEQTVEGGITRIMGLYQNIDDVPMLGSIRSARTAYLELALSHDAVLVHCGASSMANSEMKEWKVDHIDAMVSSSKYFWRDAGRKAAGYSSEHTLVSNGKRVREIFNEQSRIRLAEDRGAAPLVFTEETAPADGTRAENITVSFNSAKTTGFTYNAESRLYAVSQYGSVMKDGAPGGGTVEVTNLIVIQTAIRNMGDKDGHMAIDLQSGGSGYYAAGGKMIPIRWSRAGLKAPLIYAREDGTPLSLSIGRTYVCIIPKDRTPDWGK